MVAPKMGSVSSMASLFESLCEMARGASMGTAQDGTDVRVLVDRALPFLTSVDDLEQFAGAFEHPRDTSVAVAEYVKAEKPIDGYHELKRITMLLGIGGDEESNTRDIAEALLVLRQRSVTKACLNTVGDDLEVIKEKSMLVHYLSGDDEYHETHAKRAAYHAFHVLNGDIPSTVEFARSVNCGIVHNEVLAVSAEKLHLNLVQGLMLLRAVHGDGSATKVRIINALDQGMRRDVATLDQVEVEEFISHISVTDNTDAASRDAEQLVCDIVVPRTKSVGEIIRIAHLFTVKSGHHRILRAWLKQYGLPNEATAVALVMAIKTSAFGGDDLRREIGKLCREKGYKFDPNSINQMPDASDMLEGLAGVLDGAEGGLGESLIDALLRSGAARVARA